jgi:exodeoxyribonuclease V alpha subunit
MMDLKQLLAKHKAAIAAVEKPAVAITPTIFNQLEALKSPAAKTQQAEPSIHLTSNNNTVASDETVDDNEIQAISADFSPPSDDYSHRQITDKYGNIITLNERQWQAVEHALAGESFVLIGPAGTGKTTTMKAVMQALFNAGKIPQMSGHGHKYLPENAPGVSISAFTRRATNNIRRNVSEDLQANCITIHKLLEYEPQFYTEWDEEKEKEINKMSFEPARTADNPLPQSLAAVAFEESSMIATQLYNEVRAALPHTHQEIFLGDIQQLPPVFGQAVLGFKMLELPVVELTEVYRQAFDSPIIKLAHRILSGVPIPKDEIKGDWQFPGKLRIHPWQKRIGADSAVLTLAKFFRACTRQGECTILRLMRIFIPFNKGCGSDELNKHIANKIAKNIRKKPYGKLSMGSKRVTITQSEIKCFYDREDAIITNIYSNPTYSGAKAQHESKALDYWGNKKKSEDAVSDSAVSDDDVDFILAQVSLQKTGEDDERVRACSHVIELQLLDSDRTVRIDAAGQLNNLILGYAITIHKSQGSEWDKVFLCLHQSHATMLQRELLYTAVTRAKKRTLYHL